MFIQVSDTNTDNADMEFVNFAKGCPIPHMHMVTGQGAMASNISY